MVDILLIVLIGVFMGFSSGMFGIGGSVVATPLISLIVGLPSLIAIATPLPAAIPSAVSGSIKYYKSKLINFKLAGIALITAIPFGLLGSWASDFVDPTALIIGKAAFLALLGLKFFISSRLLKEDDSPQKTSILGGLISGALAGFVAGIIAVGGGIVLVTAFARVNNLKMKNAVATSLFCVGVLALINSIMHFNLGHVDVKTTLILAATVVPFSYMGAKLAVSLKNKTLELLFGAAMILFALYFIVVQLIQNSI